MGNVCPASCPCGGDTGDYRVAYRGLDETVDITPGQRQAKQRGAATKPARRQRVAYNVAGNVVTIEPAGGRGLPRRASPRQRQRQRQWLHERRPQRGARGNVGIDSRPLLEHEELEYEDETTAGAPLQELSLKPYLKLDSSPRRPGRTSQRGSRQSPRGSPRQSPRGSPERRTQAVTDESSAAASVAEIYEKESFISAATSLEAVIEYVVLTEGHIPAKHEILAFVLGCRVVTTPRDILNHVYGLCTDAHMMGNLGTVLRYWTDLVPYDFLDNEMMVVLEGIRDNVTVTHPDFKREFKFLFSFLQKRLDKLVTFEQSVQEQTMKYLTGDEGQGQAERLNPTTPTICEISPDPKFLAQQLTLIELERFMHIGPEELVETIYPAKGTSKAEYSRKLNIAIYARWGKRLKYFVATEICMHMRDKARRARVIEYFIDVAEECWRIGNFNSSVQILDALLIMIPIMRLRKTWKRVRKDKLQCLEALRDKAFDYGRYRVLLADHIASVTVEGEQCVIPYFDVFVRDMKTQDQNNPTTLEGGSINFEKYWDLARTMLDYVKWKSLKCSFQKHDDIYNYVVGTQLFDEKRLERVSFEVERPADDRELKIYQELLEEEFL